jgi:dTDP-4-dehydrorhamnose 3,5-epimerase
MEFTPLDIRDVILVTPKVFEDERGFFLESFREDRFSAAGIMARFVQDNHSASSQGVLRGLHYQIQQAQGKLLRCTMGEIYDVAVDIRRSSPTFGRWVAVVLSARNKQMLWVPPGFAHGFYVMSEHAELLYKTSDYYAPQYERSLLWSDPALNIPWPLVNGQPPILSKKDADGTPLAQAETYE